MGSLGIGLTPLADGSQALIESYGYTSCTSCRKTDEVLKQSGTAYASRDFFRNRFTRDELQGILDRAGLTPFDVLSKRSKVYKARGEEIDRLDAEALLGLMIEEPTLLRRPLVIQGANSVIGHNPGKLGELIAHND